MSKKFSIKHRRKLSEAQKRIGAIPPSRKGMINNLVGQQFDRLIVIKLAGQNHNRQTLWLCRCNCGNIKTIRSDNLISGAVCSCGCLRKEIITKHGHANKGKYSPEYISWEHMIQRCYDVNLSAYRYYGGRGIKVCSRWKDSFINFLNDMGKKPSPELSIDRIDNDGDYELFNCRWATSKEQNNNRRK